MFAGYGDPSVGAGGGRAPGRGAPVPAAGDDAAAVARALGDRFGLPMWQFTLSATQANTEALRVARAVTGRDGVVMFDGKYHGHADELLGALEDDGSRPRAWVSAATRPGTCASSSTTTSTRSSASWPRRRRVRDGRGCGHQRRRDPPGRGFHAGPAAPDRRGRRAARARRDPHAGRRAGRADRPLEPGARPPRRGQVDRQRHPARRLRHARGHRRRARAAAGRLLGEEVATGGTLFANALR